MNLMNDEQILMQSKNNETVLTTHRIRQDKNNSDVGLTSIMLEDVTSCEVKKEFHKIFIYIIISLLIIAIIAGAALNREATGLIRTILLIDIVLLIIFFATSKKGLFVSSPTAKIFLNSKGQDKEVIKSFIELLENAKNNRFLRNSTTENN